MKRFFTLLIISTILPSTAYAINYFWCEKNDNCVKAYGGCGRYFSVHGRYKELYEAKAHAGDKIANCLAPTDLDRKMQRVGVPMCRKKRCLLTLPKQEDKSPEGK